MTRRINPMNRRNNRKGMVLIVALLIMAIMSIIGATAITTSRIDIQISNNTKLSRQAFYFADGGLEQTPKYVRLIADSPAGTVPAAPNVTFSADLYAEIMGFPCPGTDCGVNDWVNFRQPGAGPNTNAPDISTTMGGNSLLVDVDRDVARTVAGSGVEFATGAEGAGGGNIGGIMIFYDFNAVGQGTNNSESYLDVYYRLVPGVAGGK